MYNINRKKSDFRLNFGVPGIPTTVGKITEFKGKDEDKYKVEGFRLQKDPKLPQREVKFNRIDKPKIMKEDNKMTYSKGKKDKAQYISKAISNTNNIRMYGIDERDGSPVRLNVRNDETLFVNPFFEGGYITSDPAQNIQNSKLALNVNVFAPTGYINSKADTNFKNIFDKMLVKISAQSNASAYNLFTIQNADAYFEVVYQLLDLYYCVDSFLAWKPDTEENNEAMKSIKSLFDNAALLEAKYNARQFLTGIAYPTGLINHCNWSNQTYRTSPLSHSILMKNCNFLVAKSLNDGNVDAIVQGFKQYVSDLSATTDTPSTLTSRTRATISSLLLRFMDIPAISNIPLSCNTSTYDPDFSDVFRNQSVLYGSNSFYPDTALVDTSRLFCISTDPKQVKISTLALTGYLGNSLTSTGLNFEFGYQLSQTMKTNKLCYSWQGSKFYLTHRNNYEWNITNDTHCVDTSGTANRRISKGSTDTQNVYYQGSKNIDVALREYQNSLYGL